MQQYKIKILAIASALLLLSHTVLAEAGTSTRLVSLKAGAQFLNEEVEIARTKAEQDTSSNVFGFSIENRLPIFTWGIAVSSFEGDWKTKIPSSRKSGHYKILTVAAEFKKSFRIYRDLFFYGGGGIGVSFIDSRFVKVDSSTVNGIHEDRNDKAALATVLGNLGIEYRFDVLTVFLDSQLIAMDGGESSNSEFNRYPSLSGPRLMLGVGFFF